MHVGRPSFPNQIIGRTQEVNEIVTKLTSKVGYNLALVGYRRIGKTSILHKVENVLSKNKKILIINFDVQYNLGDPESFLESLQETIFESYLKKVNGIQKLKTKYQKIIPQITKIFTTKKIKDISIEMSHNVITGEIKLKPKLNFTAKEKNYRKMFESVFSTINSISENSNMKCIVILDEFQDIIKLQRYKKLKNILDLFRGIIQQRSKNVSFIICGSHVHMLKTILSNQDSSLFQHFVQIPIGEMKKSDAIKLFNKYIQNYKKKFDNNIAEKAFELIGGHPYYLMALAEELESGLTLKETLIKSLSSPVGIFRLYSEYIISEAISRAQGGPLLKSILIELSKTSGMTSTEIAKRFNKPASFIVPYINELIKSDLVYKNKKYIIRDKVIGEFFNHHYNQ